MRPNILSGSIVAIGAVACVSPPLEAPRPCIAEQTQFPVQVRVKNKVDVLFMVDNSASMSAMQSELKNRFDQFFTVFEDLAANGTYADLNIGVVTSDFGAGRSGPPDGACDASPGGERGILQRLGAVADAGCLPPIGSNFIHYDFAGGGKDNNLPAGQNLHATFKCMASVGDTGCGFEHQLESVYAALHNDLPENAGFLRDDAMLAVVFLTNEDDASAPADTDLYLRSMFGRDYFWNGVDEGPFGVMDSYSRQTRFAIQCGSPARFPPYGDSGGPLDGCVPAPNPDGGGPGKAYDVARYTSFFTRPRVQGGVKVDPGDVILVGIDAPSSPVSVILSNPGTIAGQPYTKCPQLDEGATPPCVPVLQHSCVNGATPAFFGDPSVRLNTVIAAAKIHSISSICDSDYSGALQQLGHLIASNIGLGCIDHPVADAAAPSCVVEDLVDHADGTTTVVEIPSCATSGPPCWKIEKKPDCALSPQGIGVTIVRATPAATGTTARVSCETIAAGTVDGGAC